MNHTCARRPRLELGLGYKHGGDIAHVRPRRSVELAQGHHPLAVATMIHELGSQWRSFGVLLGEMPKNRNEDATKKKLSRTRHRVSSISMVPIIDCAWAK